jgi:hypothetical protein
VSVKDDLLDDFPNVYPGLGRSDIERLLTLLDETASTERGLSLSLATALRPLVPDIATRLGSYKDGDVNEYVGMLRGAAVLLLQEWQPDEQPPAPDSISTSIEAAVTDG